MLPLIPDSLLYGQAPGEEYDPEGSIDTINYPFVSAATGVLAKKKKKEDEGLKPGFWKGRFLPFLGQALQGAIDTAAVPGTGSGVRDFMTGVAGASQAREARAKAMLDLQSKQTQQDLKNAQAQLAISKTENEQQKKSIEEMKEKGRNERAAGVQAGAMDRTKYKERRASIASGIDPDTLAPLDEDEIPLKMAEEIKTQRANQKLIGARQENVESQTELNQQKADKIFSEIGKEPNLHFSQSVDDKGGVHIFGLDPQSGELKFNKYFPGSGKSKTEAPPVDPAVAQYLGAIFSITGKMPQGSLGRGSEKLRAAAVKVAADRAKESGLNEEGVVALQARWRANELGMGALQKVYSNVEAFSNAAAGAMGRAMQLAKKVDRTGSPLLNRYIQSTQREILGDPDLKALDFQLHTALNEFVKVTASATGNGQIAQAERDKWEERLRAADNPATWDAIYASFLADLNFRKQGFQDELNKMTGEMANPVQSFGGPAGIVPPNVATGNTTGMVIVKAKKNGRSVQIPKNDPRVAAARAKPDEFEVIE